MRTGCSTEHGRPPGRLLKFAWRAEKAGTTSCEKSSLAFRVKHATAGSAERNRAIQTSSRVRTLVATGRVRSVALETEPASVVVAAGEDLAVFHALACLVFA